MLSKIFAVSVLLLISWSPVWATEYYVSNNTSNGYTAGSDANSCAQAQSKATPKATINAGKTCLAASDTLTINQGTYTNQAITSPPSGTASAYTIVRADPAGTRPVLASDSSSSAAYGVNLYSVTRSYIEIRGFEFNGVWTCVRSQAAAGGMNHHFRYINNICHDTFTHGFLIDGPTNEDHYFADNDIYRIGVGRPTYTVGINAFYGAGSRALIERNIIHDSAAGIVIYHAAGLSHFDVIIRYNILYNIARYDLAGNEWMTIQVCGEDPPVSCNDLAYAITHAGPGSGSQIYGNVVYNSRALGISLITSYNGTAATIYNNTIYNTSQPVNTYGIWINRGTGAVVKNNISYIGGTVQIDTGTGSGSNNQTTDPSFVNAASANFTLAAGSTAIETGVAVGLPYNGSAPNKGSYQDPRLLSCSVESGDTSNIRMIFQENAGPPMLPNGGATGITAREAGTPKTMSTNSRVGDVRIDQLVTVGFGAGAIDVSRGTTNITSSFFVGPSWAATIFRQGWIQTVSNFPCANNTGGAPTHAWHQDAWRFFEARAPLATARQFKGTSLVTADTDNVHASIAPGGLVVLDLAIVGKTADPPAEGFFLYAKLNGGAAFSVTDAFGANKIRYCGESDTVNIPNSGESVPNRTTLAGAYTAGQLVRRQSGVPTTDLPLNGKTENAYCFEVDPTAVRDVDYFDFEVRRQDGTTTSLVFNQVPRLSVVTPGGAGFAELWDLLLLTFLPMLGRIEVQTAKLPSNFIVGFPNVDQVTLEGVPCASLKTTGSGLKRTVTCLH